METVTVTFTKDQLKLLLGYIEATMDGVDRCADAVMDCLDEALPYEPKPDLSEDEAVDAEDAHADLQWETLNGALAALEAAAKC